MQFNELPSVNNIGIITQYQEISGYGSTTPLYMATNYYHIPAVPIFFITIIFLFFAERIIKEFLIRWRK